MSRAPHPKFRCSIVAICLVALGQPIAAQPATWTGTVNGNWNTAGNWTPAGVPNSGTADVSFFNPGAGSVNLSSTVAAHSLTFNSTVAYTLTSNAGQVLNGLSVIAVSGFTSPTQTINLANVSTGSLLFTGSGPGALTITNNPQFPSMPTLVIGPNTVIGTPGLGGITVAGNGYTQISASFASGTNAVVGGLTKIGNGLLVISGDASNLLGGQNGGASVVLAGGELRADYSSNTANKLGGNGLTLSGGTLSLVANAVIPVIQAAAGGTTIGNGHTFIFPSTNHGALAALTLNLGAITRTGAGTFEIDFDTNTTVTTTAPLANNIIGPYATVNESDWATKVGNNTVALGSAGAPVYGVNVYSSGTNTDVTAGAAPANFTTNSLRLNVSGQVLSLSGTNTLQSGGILVGRVNSDVTLVGGTLTTPGGTGELIINEFGNLGTLVVYSRLVTSGGLTLTGFNPITLSGDNTGLTGPLNLNRGGARFTTAQSFAGFSAVNFNDPNGQTLYFHLPDGQNATFIPGVRFGAGAAGFSNEAQNSRITISGVLNSVPGTVTSLFFDGLAGANGFNLTNTNTFAGDVSVGRGTLGIASNASLGNPGNLLFLGSVSSVATLEFLNGGTDFGHPIFLGNGGTARFLVTGANTDIVSGSLAGGGLLVKDGTGTLVLSGDSNNNYGGIQILAGTLKVSSAFNFGANGDIAITAGTLSATSTFTIPSNRRLVLGPAGGAGAGVVDVAAGQSLTAAGPVVNPNSGIGALVKTGAGTLVLSNAGNTYAGGTTVQQGVLQVSTDVFLGATSGPVSIGPLGTLTYTNTTSTGRTFTSNGGTLSIATGQTLNFDGAAVGGGFLGTGAFVLTGSATMGGVTTLPSATLNQSGPATLTNFTNGGTLNNATGQTLAWNGGLNQSSGLFTVNGSSNVSDWTSNGRTAVNPGSTLTNIQGTMTFGGGSVTNIGIYNPNNGQVTPGGTINIGSGDMRVQGGFVRNNGMITGNGNLIIDYGGLVKGAGEIDLPNAPIRINGGQLLAGNSPGLTRITNFSLVSTGVTGGDFSNATGIAGPPIGSTGAQLSGFSVFEYGNNTNTGGSARVEGTPASRAIWQFRTVIDGGDYSTAGVPANFNAAQSYTWNIVRPRSAADVANPNNITPINTVAQLSIFDTATMTNVALNNANLNTYLRFDDTAWIWGSVPIDQRGTFAFGLLPDALGVPNRVISVTYTPVPEPFGILVVCAAGVCLRVRCWRQARMEPGAS